MQINRFQSYVWGWLNKCFAPAIIEDPAERNHRFLEEACELVQACGCTPQEAHRVVDYVFARPAGDKRQEAGGVMITLAALAEVQRIDLQLAAKEELERIGRPEVIEKIRAKQAAKPNLRNTGAANAE